MSRTLLVYADADSKGKAKNLTKFKTPVDLFSNLNKKIQVKREPPPPKNQYRAPGGIRWAMVPGYFSCEKGWKRSEIVVWLEVNRAIQFKWRHGQKIGHGRISVPQLMQFTGLSERTVFYALRGLKDKGIIYGLPRPGRTTTYYLCHPYANGRLPPPLQLAASLIYIKEYSDNTSAPADDSTLQKESFKPLDIEASVEHLLRSSKKGFAWWKRRP